MKGEVLLRGSAWSKAPERVRRPADRASRRCSRPDHQPAPHLTGWDRFADTSADPPVRTLPLGATPLPDGARVAFPEARSTSGQGSWSRDWLSDWLGARPHACRRASAAGRLFRLMPPSPTSDGLAAPTARKRAWACCSSAISTWPVKTLLHGVMAISPMDAGSALG